MHGFGRRAGFALGWAAVALAALTVSACTPFVTVTRVSAAAVGRQLATSALTGDELSTATRNVLLVPVVFVHRTFSSSVRWAEMVNRVEADPVLRHNYQFWFFAYDSSNPMAFSALQLRRLLTDAVERLDPEGKDPALSRMVLIGHSQGGLLVKLMAIDSGFALPTAIDNMVESELVVHSGHSTQSAPATIEEVRRILRLHLATP